MAKYLSDDEFFSMADGQKNYLSDDEFFAMASKDAEPEKTEAPSFLSRLGDAIVSEGREGLAALRDFRNSTLTPNLKEPYESVLGRQPGGSADDAASSRLASDEAQLKQAVSGLAPEDRVRYLRMVAGDDGPLAAVAKGMVDRAASEAAARDMFTSQADRDIAKSFKPKSGKGPGNGVVELPADVGGKIEDVYRKPQDIAKDNLALDRASGLNRDALEKQGDALRDEARLERENERLRRRDFTRENTGLGGLAAGSANVLTGVLNTPTVAADFFNKTAVNPVLQLVGLPPMERVPNAPGTDFLQRAAKEYTPAVADMEPDDAWREGKFGAWSYAQLAVQAPQLAQLIGLGSIPALRNYMLAGMGAQTAGSSYAGGDDSRIAAGKGAIEGLTEMLPFKAVDKVVDAIKVMPAGARGNVMKAIGQQVAKSAAIIAAASGTNFVEEGVAQLGGNVLDKYAAGKDIPLSSGVFKAATVGAIAGTPFAAPAVVRSVDEQVRGDAATQALAGALNGGQFTQSGIDAEVANNLRTQPGSSSMISPAATTVGAQNDAMPVAPAATAAAPQVSEKALVESARDQAMADIGTATTVDDAIAAANATVQLGGRAVQLDSDKMLADVLQSSPELRDALAPVDAVQQPAGTEAPQAGQATQLAGGQSAVTASASTNYGVGNAVAPSRVVWTGRRGDGYATPEDASRALTERQRLRPAYDWSVQQNPEGRYVLEGMPKGQNGATQAPTASVNTSAAPMAQNAPASLGDQLAAAGMAQPKETVRELRDQADKVQRLQAAIARSGDDASTIELYRGGRDSQDELGVGRRGASGAAVVARAVEEVGRAAQVAFGWKPIAVTGLRNAFGVQYAGQVFINVEQVAEGDSKGNTPELIAIQTIGHETTHALEKSKDPQDQADYARLREVILANVKPGVVDSRVAFEKEGQDYGEKEVVADISGSFWSDPSFWSRLYDLDDGSTMRRIAYKFMENATKFVKAVKGTRFDNERFINNVDQVREVAAQVWASKAKRGDSLFGGQPNTDQTVSKSASKDARPGVSAEVAPDPRNKEAAQRWGGLTEVDKLGITKEVMDDLAAEVFDKMGLDGWTVEYTSGMFEGGINPSAILRAPDGTAPELLGETMRVFGYLLDQKGMVAFDESNTTSGSQAGFVKVVLPKGLSTARIDAIRAEIAARVPQAEGDTVRDGAIVYGNFSALNDKIETLEDAQFLDAIHAAADAMPEQLEVAGPFRFHSEYDQAYWSETDYDPNGRDAYLENTRYASNQESPTTGRDGVRGRSGGDVSRAWIEALASATDAKVAQLVEQRQPAADSRGAGAAQQGDGDRGPAAGRDADAGQSEPVSRSRAGGGDGDNRLAPPPRYGTPREGAVSVVGYHFSKAPRTSLSGGFYGTGLKGDEANRLGGPENADIRPRVFFYVDRGNGVMPEFGVGPHPHHVKLDNLYDVAADPLGIIRSASKGETQHERSNNWERAVMQAGFDGYVWRDPVTPQHFAVLVGKKHSAVPVAKANPRRLDGKANIAPVPSNPKAEVTRKVGNELVRRPVGDEVIEVIKAELEGIGKAAPSFKRLYGEARVLESEAAAADAVFEQRGAKFRFGEVSFSRADVAETPNFKRWFKNSQVVDADGNPLVSRSSLVAARKSAMLEGRMNGGSSNAKSIADLLVSQAFSLKGLGGLEIPAQRKVLNGVLSLGDDFKVLRSVVDLVPVDVVNILAGKNLAPEVFFRDEAMLKQLLSADRDGSVSTAIDIADALVVAVAGVAAKGSAIASNPFAGTQKVGSAADTGDADVLHEAILNQATGNNGNYDAADRRISYSSADADFSGFDINLDIDDLSNESLSFLDDTQTLQATLQAELEASQRAQVATVAIDAPTAEQVAEAGYRAGSDFDLSAAIRYEPSLGSFMFTVPKFARQLVDSVNIENSADAPRVTMHMRNGTASFIHRAPGMDAAKRYISRQVAGAHLDSVGFDIASAYRKGTTQKIASTWKAISKAGGFFKLPGAVGGKTFEQVAEELGAFKGYEVKVVGNTRTGTVMFKHTATGAEPSASYANYNGVMECCTMDLRGAGGLGAEFYAVMGQLAENLGSSFKADDVLSGINTYRRTEQAMSYALKSGRTDVLLPGPQNRVHGYNNNPKTQADHDLNIARLAIAGMRNVEELFPEVRRLSYDPATDKFTATGRDAEQMVKDALDNPEARAFGLGRSAIARAVITSEIIKGTMSAADVSQFAKPVAYSKADVDLDAPMAEGWGDESGVTPGLRRFAAGSKIVHSDGRPVMMYHGTARDIHAFRGKQAGAIFLSYSPRFAGDFAALSGQWMQDHWDQVLTPEQIEQAKKTAAAAVMADKTIKMTERKVMKQSIMDGKPEGMAADAMNEAVRDMMPSGENILPVFVRATAPFDFRDKAMVDDVAGFLFDKNMAGENDKVRIRLVSEKGDRANMNARVMRELISGGAWDVIESPEVQEVIRELGHDGFFVKEDGQINLAVYEPGQVKSVFNRGTFDPLDERLSYSRRAGPKEFNYRDNYLVPELDGAFDDDSGNIAVMPALIFAKDGIRREFKSMPVRIRVGDHQYGDGLKKQYGLQHRIGNKSKDASRAYITPELEGDNASALEVERAARDITLGILDAQTAYADSAPAKIYLHSPSLNRSTVLERQTDSKGKPFWSVVTSMPSTREQMMRRYKAPTSIFGLTLNGDRSQQSAETQRGILKKLREPGRPQLSAESYILDDDGLLIHQDPAPESTNKVDVPKVVKQLPRDENGRIILNRRKAQADGGVSMSRTDIEESPNFKRWFGDSKVVDANGKPLVVYRGTAADVEFFDPLALGANTQVKSAKGGFFFAASPTVASGYAMLSETRPGLRNKILANAADSDVLPEELKKMLREASETFTAEDFRDGVPIGDNIRKSMTAGANVLPIYVSIQNPLVVDYKGEDYRERSFASWIKDAKDAGNDGVIFRNAEDSMHRDYAETTDIFVAFRPEQVKSAVGNNGNFDPTDRRISYSKAAGYDIPAENWAYKARRKMQDYFIRARRVQEAIASQGGVVDEKTDFYRAEELSHGRIASLLQDFANQQVQPLMEKAVKFGIELDELSLYAYAKHAHERNKQIAKIDPQLQDGGSGMTNDEADGILKLVELSGDKDKFEELHTDLMTITRGNRMAMLADGLITQDEFNALEGAYDYYVPLRGFELVDENDKPTGRSMGKGFNIRGAETLRAKGRVSRAGQIIENIISDHQRTIVRGERNHVAKVFLNFALTNPDPDLWEIDTTTTRKSIDRKTGRIARDTAIEKGEDTIAVKVKGHEIYIKIKDDLLLRALRKSYTDETGELTSDLMKSVGLYSSLLRNTLTRYNPEFAVVNAMRDLGFGAAAVLDELGEKGAAKFLAHYSGAMAVSARNESKKLDASREWDKWFLEYKAAGGTTSGFYAKGLDEISSDIRDMMIEAGAAPKDWSEKVRFNKATRAAKAAMRVLEYAGSVSENAARVSAYRTAREMGKTPSQAASIAKNLTTNFDRKGEYGQIANALYLFYNAAIQGTHRTLKMFKNPKIMGYMAGVTAASVGLAMVSAAAGGDDPDDGMAYWDKIPAYVKERNIIIMLPPGTQVEGAEEVGTKGRYITIPVQYGLNIFHVIGYQIADVIRNQADPVRGVGWKKGGVNIASAMAGSFNPFGGAVDLTNTSSVVQAILPTIFDFPYQLASGTNAFGRDVAPFKSPFDSKPDSQNSNVRQSGSPAERVAQWMNDVTGGSEYESGAVDISAGTVENVVRNLTGGTGIFIYDVLALGGKWVDHVGGNDPDLFVRDMPVVRRVTGETAGDVDQGLFYERRKAIQEARAIEKGAIEAGGEITDKKKLAMASMSSEAAKYTKWLAEVRKEMKVVQRDDGLTKQERRLKLRELRAERDRLTASFNAAFTELMREELAPSLGRE